MGVILNAYTVYFDLVLCTPAGRIIANGRPGEFRSVGIQVAQCEWFKGMDKLFVEKKGFVVTDYEGGSVMVAHAFSPGFETYSTGWHSVIVQRLR